MIGGSVLLKIGLHINRLVPDRSRGVAVLPGEDLADTVVGNQEYRGKMSEEQKAAGKMQRRRLQGKRL